MIAVFAITAIGLVVSSTANAQPYGAGAYSSNVPYGSATSLSISATSAVNLTITPSVSGTLGTASGPVTVTSTDVVGYRLYIRAIGSTDMTTALGSIPASANGSLAPLALNTWGYNTTGATDFLGITASDVLIKAGTGPFSGGDTTTVTYGLNVDRSKAAGTYSSSILYTAVPQTD